MVDVYRCAEPVARAAGLRAASSSARRGGLVVLPTDTLYGLGCDAFNSTAVSDLLAAKGRGRDMPVPVLVGSRHTITGLTDHLSAEAHDLMRAFWPGALTVVVRHARSLAWDLGDAQGTVAVRMPLHPVALELLRDVGPMAVSSANLSGRPPATSVGQAVEYFADRVAVYLDGGVSLEGVPSTIVDCTSSTPRVLRAGAIGIDLLREVVAHVDMPHAAP